MRTNILIFLVFFLVSAVSAQDITTSANGLKSDKQLRKEKKEAERHFQYMVVGHLIDSMRFVLEADYLSGNSGVRTMVSSSLNYILVDSLKGAIQTGSNMGFGGNGVGGATAKGSISSWKVFRNDKKDYYSIKIDMSTNLGFYTIFMDVFPDLRASARLTGIGRGSLNMDGFIVPLKKSRIYRATSVF